MWPRVHKISHRYSDPISEFNSAPSADAAKLLQLCLTVGDPMDCSPPGFSVHGILQERILDWLSCPHPGDPPDPGIILHLSCLLHWQKSSLPLEPPGMWPWVHKISHRYSDPISVFNIFLLFLLLLPCSKQILPCFWVFVFISCFWFYSHSLYLKRWTLVFIFISGSQ